MEGKWVGVCMACMGVCIAIFVGIVPPRAPTTPLGVGSDITLEAPILGSIFIGMFAAEAGVTEDPLDVVYTKVAGPTDAIAMGVIVMGADVVSNLAGSDTDVHVDVTRGHRRGADRRTGAGVGDRSQGQHWCGGTE